ncbi:MAG: MucR family transcriptional regulator [Alphaproteobacteria bacterium]
MAARIVAAYVGSHEVPATAVPKLVRAVHASLAGIAGGWSSSGQPPAIAVERSVLPDYIVCLEDGRPLKLLKRHLRAVYGLTPAQYREKWNLPPDYPMAAPNYVRLRREFAKRVGLGKQGRKKRARAHSTA